MKFLRKLGNYFKNHKILTITGIIILVILFFVFRPKPKASVSTTTVQRSSITQTVAESGKVTVKSIADLSFLTGGKLTYLGVKVGDQVNQYQTIAAIDQRTAQKNLQSTLIDYSKQRNNFDQTQSDNLNRTPQQALNDQMKRILQNNQFDLDKAVNSVELQSLAAENTVLSTPIAGIVTRADATTAGVDVAPTAIFEVVDPNSMVFAMDVDEADIGQIKIGQQASITMDAYSNETIKLPVNRIDFVSHNTSTGGVAFTVEAQLNNPMKYRIGMQGNAQITTNEKDNVLIIPIISLQNDKYVYAKKGNGFERRAITIGMQDDTNAEVASGLQEGEVVATNPSAAALQTVK